MANKADKDLIKVGQRIELNWLAKQLYPFWVVLINLDRRMGGVYGGEVKHIAESKTKAGNRAVALENKGIETFVTSGSFDGICVGDIFV